VSLLLENVNLPLPTRISDDPSGNSCCLIGEASERVFTTELGVHPLGESVSDRGPAASAPGGIKRFTRFVDGNDF
jgi:hypothetical protein